MIKNNFVLAARGMRKRPGYTGITVFGLAIGMACCLLILSYARQQWTYDTFHDDVESIVRINIDSRSPSGERVIKAGQPIPLAAELASAFDDVIAAVPVIVDEDLLVESNDVVFTEQGLFTDPGFFEVFTFPFIQGSAENALEAPESVVLSKSAALKYFGDTDVLNRNIRLSIEGRFSDRMVSGVVEDPPSNSSIQFTVVRPIADWTGFESLSENWTSWVTNTYAKLRGDHEIDRFSGQLETFTAEHYAPMIETWKILQWISREDGAFRLQLQPLTDIHFSPGIEQAQFQATDPRFPLFLLALGVAVLLIACVNFMTLSMGRAARRAREVGMRKVLGAARLQLMNQFWVEALLTSGVSLFIGLFLARMALPVFSELAGSSVSFMFDRTAVLLLLGLLLVTGLLAGAYPAVVLSRFRTATIAKSGSTINGGSRWMQALVVVQFTLSIVFIVGILVISAQLKLLQKSDLGFDRDQVLVVETFSTDPEESEQLVQTLKSDWERLSGVVGVAASSSGFNRSLGWNSFGSAEGEAHFYYTNRIDRSYLETMGMSLVEGQAFTEDFPRDPTGVLLVNESLVRDFGWEDPIGQPVGNAGTVAGVVSDYYFKSLHTAVEPMALFLSSKGDDPFRYVYVRLSGSEMTDTISGLEESWKRIVPDRPFQWNFLDDSLESQYASERRIQLLVTAAGGFAILIACLGLFGLAAYAAERRTKEIGIRKVVGAGIPSIVALVSAEFIVLVGIAILFATPIALIYLNRWLDGFAHRIEISFWMPITASAAALLIALATVSYHAFRAARANPVSSLRSE